jgi:hypothetical protein
MPPRPVDGGCVLAILTGEPLEPSEFRFPLSGGLLTGA